MSQGYQRMSLAEREELSIRHAQGLGVRSIAREPGRSPSTISRELARHRSGFYYRAVTAQNKAARRCFRKPRRLAVDRRLRHTVFRLLRRQWSPQQIRDRQRRQHPHEPSLQMSAETIHSYLYVVPRGELRRELLSHWRQHRKNRRPRSRRAYRRGQIPEMISITERPAEVADRTIPEHWEGDLILGCGHQSALGTLVERTTCTVLLVRLPARDATSVRKALARKLKHVPKQMKLTLTYDRGREMTEHRLFTHGYADAGIFCASTKSVGTRHQ